MQWQKPKRENRQGGFLGTSFGKGHEDWLGRWGSIGIHQMHTLVLFLWVQSWQESPQKSFVYLTNSFVFHFYCILLRKKWIPWKKCVCVKKQVFSFYCFLPHKIIYPMKNVLCLCQEKTFLQLMSCYVLPHHKEKNPMK